MDWNGLRMVCEMEMDGCWIGWTCVLFGNDGECGLGNPLLSLRMNAHLFFFERLLHSIGFVFHLRHERMKPQNLQVISQIVVATTLRQCPYLIQSPVVFRISARKRL